MHPSDVVRKYIRQGTILSERYEVEGFIGSGAYGSIFSAIDQVTMERVAVKALPPPNQGVNETAIGRFKREMKVISSLRHANVISLYDFGRTPDHIVFMVLEYLDGPTLYDLVSGQTFSSEQALDVTKQIAQGLGAAHALGVVHRDLKPQNIMLIPERNGDYHVKVLDFGMAKLLMRLNDESIIQLTREGVAVGTPRYIAPEQARGKTVGPYSDLYALGLLMYEMFTGARAVKADSIESAIMAHVSRKPLKLDEINDVPENVRPVLHKLIEKSVKNRYQTAEEVIEDIRQIELKAGKAVPRSITTTPKGAPEPAEKSNDDRVRSIHSAESLRLDYDRFDQYAPSSPGGKKRTQQRSRRGSASALAEAIRLPETSAETVETALCMVFTPIAFTLASAPFFDSGFVLRWIIGALPAIAALGIAVWQRSDEWRFSPVRLLFLANIIAICFSHLAIESLARGLLVDPAWYLEPFDFIPGVSLVQSAIGSLSAAHVSVLADFSSSVRHVMLNVKVQ